MSVASAFYKGDKDQPQLQRRLRHLLQEQARSLTNTSNDSRRRRSATTAGWDANSGCSTSTRMVGQGLVLWKPKGSHGSAASCSDFITEELDRQGYMRGVHAAHREARAVPDQRALSVLPGEPVRADSPSGTRWRSWPTRTTSCAALVNGLRERGGRGLPAEADELPAPHQDLRQRPPQLP